MTDELKRGQPDIGHSSRETATVAQAQATVSTGLGRKLIDTDVAKFVDLATLVPELRRAVGYPFALGLMAAVCGVLYLVFRRRDWLCRRQHRTRRRR